LKAAQKDPRFSLEVRNRIDGVLKRLARKDGAAQSDDQVSAADLDVSGELDLKEFRFKSPLGDITVKIEDVESVRWLASGRFKSLSIDSKKGLEGWIDTGLNVSPGEQTAVSASGTITLFGYQSGPAGNNNFGTAPFMVGSLIGRIGKDGEPFLIGDRKKWTATDRDRLYVKIFCTPDHVRQLGRQPTSGSYRVRVATGVWVGQTPDETKDQVQHEEGAEE
jgi:hypothetical protein